MDNFMSLKVKSVSRNEAFVRSAVAAFAAELNPTVDEIGDIKTAVFGGGDELRRACVCG